MCLSGQISGQQKLLYYAAPPCSATEDSSHPPHRPHPPCCSRLTPDISEIFPTSGGAGQPSGPSVGQQGSGAGCTLCGWYAEQTAAAALCGGLVRQPRAGVVLRVLS